MKFRDLAIGQEFDFIRGIHDTSFYERCVKTGKRTYESESGMKLRIGSINCVVGRVFSDKKIGLPQTKADSFYAPNGHAGELA